MLLLSGDGESAVMKKVYHKIIIFLSYFVFSVVVG